MMFCFVLFHWFKFVFPFHSWMLFPRIICQVDGFVFMWWGIKGGGGGCFQQQLFLCCFYTESHGILIHQWYVGKFLTCCSTNMAISINISCSSLILVSNFIMSLCLASISAKVCFAAWVSIMIWNTVEYHSYCMRNYWKKIMQKKLSILWKHF